MGVLQVFFFFSFFFFPGFPGFFFFLSFFFGFSAWLGSLLLGSCLCGRCSVAFAPCALWGLWGLWSVAFLWCSVFFVLLGGGSCFWRSFAPGVSSAPGALGFFVLCGFLEGHFLVVVFFFFCFSLVVFAYAFGFSF